MNLDDLAVQAKTDERAFEELLKRVMPLCKMVANRYRSWFFDYDEILQRCRYEVWNAVKLFDPNKGNFNNLLKITVVLHTTSHLKRVYGKVMEPNRLALRLDGGKITDKGAKIEWEVEDPRDFLQELERTERDRIIHEQIHNTLTQIERESIYGVYFLELPYNDIGRNLGIKRKTVDNALQRAREKLRNNPVIQQVYQEIL